MQYAKVEREIAGRTLSFETGRIARQADGAVMVRHGDTQVLSTVCASDPRPGINFFPLTVEYREKTYAAGKFPGGFIKREGRPKDKEILTCRLIDRPVRPLWPEGYNDEVQIINTVMSVDMDNDPDVVAMNGSFAALHISGLPFQGPIAAVRVGLEDDRFVAFPTPAQVDAGLLDLILVGSRDAPVMVEGQAGELTEDRFIEALEFGNEVLKDLMDMMDELREKCGAQPSSWEPEDVEIPTVYQDAKNRYVDKMREAVLVQGKKERYAAIDKVKEDALQELVPEGEEDAEELAKWVKKGLSELETEVIRNLILDEKKRIDLRGPKDIRPISCEVGVLARTHGSALFTRGETQAIVTVTLGTPKDAQIVDGLMEEYTKHFDLQYNFPPYSVGECRPLRGVSRREIGHGALAERAVGLMVPGEDEFPYTIRVVSEVTESNGSSSMATVCGATLAMMDAGIPIRQPVAGIAMGMISEGERSVILSDILGTEDHLGDMDFKVAGTGRGITAVQMDIKIKGLDWKLLREALEQAREGRLHILREMMSAITRPRPEISMYAPRLLRLQVPQEKIGLVIGPSGSTIKKIQAETGANIEIADDGTVTISCTDAEAAMRAKEMIEQFVAEVEVGRIYMGRVVSIKDFGAFVEVLPGQEGLCHISELSDSHVRDVSDVVDVGDRIPVKVILRDEQGRLKLSHRVALAEEGGASPSGEEEGEGRDEGDRERVAAGARQGGRGRPPRSSGGGGPRGGGGRRGERRGDRRGGDRGGRRGGSSRSSRDR